MSLNWAQSNGIKTKKMDNPIEIRMATKNSKTTANYSAKEDVDIRNGKRISCEFLLVPVGSYDIILGMPFMIKTDATVRPGKGTATFGNTQTTISYAPTKPITMATPITIINSPEGSLSSLDDNEEYHDLFPQDDDSERLQHIDLIRRMATAAIETLQEPQWDKEVHDHAQQMIVYAARAYQKQIANFKNEFPSVFPDSEKIPVTLPPLRKGLNYQITLQESELSNYRNEYRPIPESKMKQLSKWLQEWKENDIAVNGPAPYAAPIFGIPKKEPGEIRWVIDLKERNRYTIRDYTSIPNQPIIQNDVASHPFRSKIDMSNAYYEMRVEPADEIKISITAEQFGAFQVKVMLQGDCNAPATMMRIMNTILSPYLGKFVWVYLDNILIFSNTYNDHLNHLRQIFKKLEENNFYLRMDKYNLLVDDIEVLGLTIKGNWIPPAKEKITHITDFPTPSSKKQLQQFLRSVNYIGSYLPHIAILQAPLTELTGTQAWEWCDLQDNAFNHIEEACNQHLPISHINYDKLQDPNILYNLYRVTCKDVATISLWKTPPEGGLGFTD